MSPLRVGIIGVGNISGIYLENLSKYASTEVVALADIDLPRAQAAADKYSIPHVFTPEQLIASDEVELVLNLTIPKAHGPVALEAVKAGKHVYNEKPLTGEFAQGQELVKLAKEKGVLVGCAPDTFLGGGLQTCRELIDSGAIGSPVAAQAFMLSRGPEPWHPSPEFFFKPGGGPMLDMGPYYLTALVNLLGPIKRTSGITGASFPFRTVGSGPLQGTQISVETPTHVSGVLEFEQGAIGEITTTFDVYHGSLHPIVIYGSEGTLRVPDPNTFGGPIEIRSAHDDEWKQVEITRPFTENSRGIGVLDLGHAARTGSDFRANGDLALHVLETMLSFGKSSESGAHQTITTKLERPRALAKDEYADQLSA